MADRIVTPEHNFSHSTRIPLPVLEKKLERDTRLITKALHILSVEDPESTHTEAGSVSGLLNHWLVNRELGYYINGQRGDDFTALTVIPVNGDYGKGLAAMEAWITIDKQELVELLRSRSFIVPDNLLNPKADRTPNWGKWRLIPKLTPSQCAALDGFKGFMESQEFKDRLDLVQANLYGALKSKNGKVELRLFAAWVREVQGTGWDSPAELLAIGDQRPQNVNWYYWGTLDLWPLDAACKLICGDDPNEQTREGDIENPDPSTRRAWVNLFHKAQASILAEKLRAQAGCVYQAEFILWARGKGAQIPPQLIAMTDDHGPRKQRAPTTAEGKMSGEPCTHNKREDLFGSRPPAPGKYFSLRPGE
jgi:hypothetical protein